MRHERIEINPAIMDGKPVIRGTRVPVELVLRELGAGMTTEPSSWSIRGLRLMIFGQPRLSRPTIWLTKTSFIAE